VFIGLADVSIAASNALVFHWSIASHLERSTSKVVEEPTWEVEQERLFQDVIGCVYDPI
jgi:hypothetical protein